MPKVPPRPFRLLAIDADGTLLDPEGALHPRTGTVIREARLAGIEVVVCTGRRLRTVRPLLLELGLEGPVVVQNGVVVKDSRSGATLRHQYLPRNLYGPALGLMRQLSSPLVYIDSPKAEIDILYEESNTEHLFQREYVEANREVAHKVPSLDLPPEHPIVMLSAMADAPAIDKLTTIVRAKLGSKVHTHRIQNKLYRGEILEIVSPLANKWSAVESLASSQGIRAEEILAIGDDENDLPMIRGAGLGIAMGNGKKELRDAADFVTQTNDNQGAARAIERWLLSPG